MILSHDHFRDLRVTKAIQDHGVLVTVAGEVDIGTVCLLEQELTAARERAPQPQVLVIDLRQVRFFGAAGVTALVRADVNCRQDGVALRIVAGHRAVLRPLEIVGLIDTLQPSPELGQEWTQPRSARTVLAAARRILTVHRHATRTSWSRVR